MLKFLKLLGPIHTFGLFFAFITFIFLIFSYYNIKSISNHIDKQPDISYTIQEIDKINSNNKEWNGILLLETNNLQNKNHLTISLLKIQLWIKYIGITSGMIMIFTGCFFILHKITDKNVTTINSELPHGIKLSLTTMSPGLILVMLGCGLTLGTIYYKNETTTNNDAIYIQHYFQSSQDSTSNSILLQP